MLIVTNYSNQNFTSRPIKYPNISRQQIKSLIEEGKRNFEIAEILKVDRHWIDDAMQRFNLTTVSKQKIIKKTNEIKALYNQNMTREDIHLKTKYSYKLIDKVIEDCDKNLDDKKLIQKIMEKLNIKCNDIII